MSKNIVVITGSPRKNGNSFAMTDSFIKAAAEKGHTVTRFDAAFLKIGGCLPCLRDLLQNRKSLFFRR